MSDSTINPHGDPTTQSPSGTDSPRVVPPAVDYQPTIPKPPTDYAYRFAGAWSRYLTPAAVGLVCDLWLKNWAFPDGVPPANGYAQLPAGRNPAEFYPPSPVIPHVLGFTTTINHGAVFGIGQGYVVFFLLFSILAMGMILWVFLSSRRDQWLVQIALGMITAGALGNLYDRAIHGGVRDMLRFYVSWYPYIFNVADVMLCVGVPLLILCWIAGGERRLATNP